MASKENEMNCPECGHDIHKHRHWGECVERGCKCGETTDKIRLAAWETEAMAARELLSMSTFETHATDVFTRCDYCNTERWAGHEEDCRYRVAKDAYLAARVKDE